MKKIIVVFVSLIIILSSCSEYEKVLKGSDYDKKYEVALKMYKKEKFMKAYPLFEEVISVFSKLSEKGERAYYYLAYSHYNLGDYPIASYYFKNYTRTYPTSEHVEECAFMSAYCKVNSSPKSTLDQSSTRKAINELQAFLNRYPKSDRKEQCNKIIDELRDKLETKAIDNAKLYYKTGNYKAATISFKNVLKDFPDTEYREELLFLTVKANYNLAVNSVEDKKKERFEETIKSYTKFVDNYPQSGMIKEVENMYNTATKQVQKLKG